MIFIQNVIIHDNISFPWTGWDSSYNVWTNESVRRGIIWGINAHNICKGDVLFSLVCTFRKAIKNFEVKVNVQKWDLRFRARLENRCVSFIQFMFSYVIVIWQCLQWLSYRFAIWILDLQIGGTWIAHVLSCVFLLNCGKVIVLLPFFVWCIIELIYAMEEKMFNDFLIGKWKWVV